MTGAGIEHLVKMANQIALNFGERRDSAAAARRTAEHLARFWTPAMRAQLAAYLARGGDGLSPVARQVFDPDFNYSGVSDE